MKFYQAILKQISEDKVLEHCYGKETAAQLRLSDRIDECPDCGCSTWILFPLESVAVREGGKPYCECMECGYMTHL